MKRCRCFPKRKQTKPCIHFKVPINTGEWDFPHLYGSLFLADIVGLEFHWLWRGPAHRRPETGKWERGKEPITGCLHWASLTCPPEVDVSDTPSRK